MTALDELTRDLRDHAADRELKTSEVHNQNDFYGNAAVLKDFMGWPSNVSLAVSLPHGVRWQDHGFWELDFREEHRIALVPGGYRADVLRPQIPQRPVPVGPYIHYARPLWSPAEMAQVRQQTGRVVLAFPAHSTHWVDADYDVERFARQLRSEYPDFNTILICLYWKDVLRGMAERYEALGLRCVTAGHIYDPLFLRRLRTLLELADTTAGMTIGTQLGYAIHLGKPHRLFLQNIAHVSHGPGLLRLPAGQKRVDFERFEALFSPPGEQITTAQRELVEKHWGLSCTKSPAELRQICEEAERLRRRYFYTSILPRQVTGAARQMLGRVPGVRKLLAPR